MKVRIDREGCISCGTCEALCPQVFKLLEEDGKSSIVEAYRQGALGEGKVDEGLAPCVNNAKGCCPVQVISTE